MGNGCSGHLEKNKNKIKQPKKFYKKGGDKKCEDI
jgi:hypothetical protein